MPDTPLKSVWRTETGAYVRIVALADGKVYVRNANGRGHTYSVLSAWFSASKDDGGFERVS